MKKIFFCLLVVSYCLLNIGFAGENDGKNLPSEWAEASIEALEMTKIFRPLAFGDYNDKVTRSDFSYLMVSVFEYYNQSEVLLDRELYFNDTYDLYALKAASADIATGVGNNMFAPNNPLSREQLVKMVIRVLDLGNVSLDAWDGALFDDDATFHDWGREAIYIARANGLVSGFEDNTFEPSGYATRQQALVIVWNMMNLIEKGHWEDSIEGVAETVDSTKEPLNIEEVRPFYIPHGGGEIDGMAITNSKEAIINAVDKGSDYIELDFLRTLDDDYIIAHDWWRATQYLGVDAEPVNRQYYMSSNSLLPLTPMDLDRLILLLHDYPGLKIVTDTKDDNVEFLTHLAHKYPTYRNRFIPQIYDMGEYDIVKALGFSDPIYTLYKVYRTDAEIIDFVKSHDVYAITMPYVRADNGFCKILGSMGVTTYVHTVNDMDLVEKYELLGVDGFYTDNLF